MLYVWILISSSDNQPLLMHSRLRLLLFSPLLYSIGLSLTTLLSVSSHFLQVFLCAFLSFFTSWKGLIPFFLSFRVAFQNSFHALGLCERWDRQHWGVPHLLACYLVSSSIKSTPPQILPPPSLSLFVVSPAVDPDEEGLIWGTLVLMWRPERQKWRLCWSLRPWEETGPPGIHLSLMFADPE